MERAGGESGEGEEEGEGEGEGEECMSRAKCTGGPGARSKDKGASTSDAAPSNCDSGTSGFLIPHAPPPSPTTELLPSGGGGGGGTAISVTKGEADPFADLAVHSSFCWLPSWPHAAAMSFIAARWSLPALAPLAQAGFYFVWVRFPTPSVRSLARAHTDQDAQPPQGTL